jgi:hypothetical protein
MTASTTKKGNKKEKRKTNQESHVSNRSNGTLSKLPQQENPLGPRGQQKRREEECKKDELGSRCQPRSSTKGPV